MALSVSFISLFNPDEMINVMEIRFDEILCMSEGLERWVNEWKSIFVLGGNVI